MKEAEIKTQLTAILRDTFNEPELQLHNDLTAADVESWDSLSHVDLIVAVESHFQIKLTTGEVRGLKNVGDFVKVIQAKVK